MNLNRVMAIGTVGVLSVSLAALDGFGKERTTGRGGKDELREGSKLPTVERDAAGKRIEQLRGGAVERRTVTDISGRGGNSAPSRAAVTAPSTEACNVDPFEVAKGTESLKALDKRVASIDGVTKFTLQNLQDAALLGHIAAEQFEKITGEVLKIPVVETDGMIVGGTAPADHMRLLFVTGPLKGDEAAQNGMMVLAGSLIAGRGKVDMTEPVTVSGKFTPAELAIAMADLRTYEMVFGPVAAKEFIRKCVKAYGLASVAVANALLAIIGTGAAVTTVASVTD